MKFPWVFPASLAKRLFTVTALAIGGAFVGATGVPAFAQNAASVKPVLVELFTSEGCSDCPPADNLLARLDSEQPISGVHVIVLSEHVTYWNHDGWKDPYSMTEMDERQNDYVAQFHLQSSYTPQAVIDGAEQMVGSNVNQLVHAVQQEAALLSKSLSISAANLDKGSVRFTIQSPDSQGDHLYAALAQDVAHSEVASGENAGRTLHHVAVVREIKEFRSKFGDGHEISISAGNLNRHQDAGHARLVVFLVNPRNGHVDGAAEQNLSEEQALSSPR